MFWLACRNLRHFWRTNCAVIAGVATAVAVLSGALLVGQSVRASLRDLLFQRLGAAEYVVVSDRFFRAELSEEFVSGTSDLVVCPIIYVPGVVIVEGADARALNVNVFGVDDRFWKFHGIPQPPPEGRSALIGAPLAARLGDTTAGILLRLESQQGVPRESLYGRKEETGRTLRLSASGILSGDRLGEFALRPSQGEVFSIFVSLERLQRDLAQSGRVNTILVSARSDLDYVPSLRKILQEKSTLEDAGVRLRLLPSHNAISVESDRVLLDDATGRVALDAAAQEGWQAAGIFSYLANSIRSGGREVPYSLITAGDLGGGALEGVRAVAGSLTSAAADPIWLNDWTARDLGAAPGDPVEIDYYAWQEDGRLATRSARFHVAGIVALGGALDATLAPDFPGISTVRGMKDWDPPFPLDLRRIRPRDEEYWDRFRATPKAFIRLADGQRLWQNRFGKLTAVRIMPAAAAPRAAQAIRSRLTPEAVGFRIDAVKRRGLEAAEGSTDFGAYFLYFSFFLIAAALLLVALFFRLGVEQRVREIGTLRALGFSMAAIGRMFLFEGCVLAAAGSLLGVLGAVGYGGLLIVGLRNWWIGAIGTREIYLHLSWPELATGALAGLVIAPLTIFWSLRGLRHNSPRALIAGTLESIPVRTRRVRFLKIASVLTLAAALFLLLASASKELADVAGFFSAGALLLASSLGLTALWFRRDPRSPISGRGALAWVRLGARSATYRPGRSLLCVALIASASFVIVSVEAFRQDSAASLAPKSGTGGYPLMAESALPVFYDPNSAAGREALSISEDLAPELSHVRFVSFRERPGDDASCLNLYSPQEPRILGAPHSFLSEGRFAFADASASTPQEKENPWRLLESALPGGAIPAIADANTIQYILHLEVGDELSVRGNGGEPVRLRLVAALRDSILQGELVISESNFLRTFPSQEGYRFFLLDAPPADAERLGRMLSTRLADWGVQVDSTRARLASYHRVENTYLSTFQSLGGLGLVLGTVGLATVLLRNVLERRRELALLRAVGYRRQVLAAVIVAENAVLMLLGLGAGAACALVAIAPALAARGGSFSIRLTALLVAAVLLAGLASSVLAVVAALRSPLLQSLRSE